VGKATKHTLAQIVAAIRGSCGIKMVIARKLGVHRNTIDHYLNRWSEARRAFQEEVDEVGDRVELTLITAIMNGDVRTARWYARVKLQDRGYSERIEHAGVAERPIEIIEIVRPYPRPPADAPAEQRN
jgi:hypothetical protein